MTLQYIFTGHKKNPSFPYILLPQMTDSKHAAKDTVNIGSKPGRASLFSGKEKEWTIKYEKNNGSKNMKY